MASCRFVTPVILASFFRHSRPKPLRIGGRVEGPPVAPDKRCEISPGEPWSSKHCRGKSQSLKTDPVSKAGAMNPPDLSNGFGPGSLVENLPVAPRFALAKSFWVQCDGLAQSPDLLRCVGVQGNDCTTGERAPRDCCVGFAAKNRSRWRAEFVCREWLPLVFGKRIAFLAECYFITTNAAPSKRGSSVRALKYVLWLYWRSRPNFFRPEVARGGVCRLLASICCSLTCRPSRRHELGTPSPGRYRPCGRRKMHVPVQECRRCDSMKASPQGRASSDNDGLEFGEISFCVVELVPANIERIANRRRWPAKMLFHLRRESSAKESTLKGGPVVHQDAGQITAVPASVRAGNHGTCSAAEEGGLRSAIESCTWCTASG